MVDRADSIALLADVLYRFVGGRISEFVGESGDRTVDIGIHQ